MSDEAPSAPPEATQELLPNGVVWRFREVHVRESAASLHAFISEDRQIEIEKVEPFGFRTTITGLTPEVARHIASVLSNLADALDGIVPTAPGSP